MIFAKTTNGYRIDGFTTIIWTDGICGKDNEAFLFSLDKKEKYKITNENYANRLNNGSNFYFGNAALISLKETPLSAALINPISFDKL